jgi:hypothetical protein
MLSLASDVVNHRKLETAVAASTQTKAFLTLSENQFGS